MELLKEGDKAPEFSALNQDGNEIKLSDFKGNKVVLYFYPKDDTPGCTAQACDLRDNHSKLLQSGYQVIGVSPDSVTKHQKFALKYELPFTLVADTEKKILQAYGVWGEKKFMGKVYDGVHRTTYVIDEEGKIEKIISKVNTKNHYAQIVD
jgi:thioredoxin-dependent peroxiredoxin